MTPLLLSLVLAAAPVTPDGGTVVAKGQRFLAEVARTPQEQALGLMHRQSLAKDRCMIFIYPEEGNRSIWMKNCLISLDVAWFKEDGTIVETAAQVPPCSPMRGDDCPTYGGAVLSRHFVEFPAGTLKRLGLGKGDRLGWNLVLSDGTAVVGGVPVPAEGGKARKTKGRRK
jgi:uncharacterized membrane protein (UPF0127 family)